MGSGKTTWAINYINSNPEKSFIFVTPFLSEIRRIKDSCPEFHDPQPINGRKIEGFNFLLQGGQNIAVTHSTFSNSNAETLQFLKENQYVLILDEVLDILVPFNDVAQNKIKKDDIKILLDNKMIEVDQFGKVSWIAETYNESCYTDVQRLANAGNLFFLDGSMLVWQFPPQIFDMLSEVYVLTFMFNGSYMKPYFEYHDIGYTMASLHNAELIPYEPVSKEAKAIIKSLIILDTEKRRNKYRGKSLSKKWCKESDSKTRLELKGHIVNYINNVIGCKSADVMWTAYNSPDCKMRKILKGKGYTRRSLSDAEKRAILQDAKLTEPERNAKLERATDCFVPCNARASNEYRDRSVCVYAVNLLPNPYMVRYFQNKNDIDGRNIHVDEDSFSLSSLLQWLWRSQIRDGKPINVYIPSTRMRELLIGWLES